MRGVSKDEDALCPMVRDGAPHSANALPGRRLLTMRKRVVLHPGPAGQPLMDLRVKSDLSNPINLICPVQSCWQKYSASRLTQIKSISFAVPFHSEGRLAIVTDAGRDAVDATALVTNGANADGEVVWS